MEDEPKHIDLPIYFLPKLLFLLAVLAAIFLFASCCTPQPEHSIRGSWNNVMIARNADIYDPGTIPSHGELSLGTYSQIDNYEIDTTGKI